MNSSVKQSCHSAKIKYRDKTKAKYGITYGVFLVINTGKRDSIYIKNGGQVLKGWFQKKVNGIFH